MWHKAAKESDYSGDKALLIELEGKKIALFRLHGKFHALDNTCPHRGGPLVEGHVEGNSVTCPWHAWQFNIITGACETMPGTKQPTYLTKVENHEIWVHIPIL